MNRSACESYEVHISALIDGEAEPADALAVLDHLPGCASCQQFTREVRELQGLVDRSPVAPGSTASLETQARSLGSALLLRDAASDGSALSERDEPSRRARRIVSIESAPRWVWALAAGLLVALGFGLGDRVGGLAPLGSVEPGGELVVELGADAGRMTEERFVALTVELLRADRRYRDKMNEVLDRVAQGERREGFDGEITTWRDEGASGEETGRSGMGEMLHVSPLKDVY